MCRLKKALYGLDIGPEYFNQEINNYLKQINFQPNKREPSIHTHWENKQITIILTYVDDILITGSNSKGIQQTLEFLKSKYKVKNMGFPKTFLGIEIQKCNRSIFLHQKSYSQEIVKHNYIAHKSNLPTAKWAVIPIPPVSDHGTMKTLKIHNFPYRQVLGALIFLTHNTCPNLTFAVHYLARF